MIVRIDLDSDRPLYRQIADGIRRSLVTGSMKPGDRLPPGRELAASLGVNLDTVQRAYRRLADEEIVSSRVGRGTRVRPDLDVGVLGVAEHVDALVEAARELGLERAAIVGLIQRRFDDG